MKYDKLVRDNIPEYIRTKGGTPLFHAAGDAGKDAVFSCPERSEGRAERADEEGSRRRPTEDAGKDAVFSCPERSEGSRAETGRFGTGSRREALADGGARREPRAARAGETEYWQKLKEKLREEVDEFNRDENQEEYADVLEALEAIGRYKGFDLDEIAKLKEAKAREKGRFEKRIILDEA